MDISNSFRDTCITKSEYMLKRLAIVKVWGLLRFNASATARVKSSQLRVKSQ